MKRYCGLYLTMLACLILVSSSCSSMQGVHNIRTDSSEFRIEAEQRLKLLTYNIRAGCGVANLSVSPYKCKSTREKLDKVVSAIQSEDPDIVALQEVRGVSQAEYIAERLNMNYTYRTHNPNNTWWGLATLSKSKILTSQRRHIYSGKDRRSAVVSQIIRSGNTVTVVNVHYHIGSFESQVNRTLSILGKIQEPKILMGDLNIRYGDFKLEPINDILQDTCTAIDTEDAKHIRYRGTWHRPGKRIDYIFTDRDSFIVKNVGLVLGQHHHASDHIGYYAIVELN